MKDAAELRAGLAHFYGTEQWFKHSLVPRMIYTEGVQFFAENAGGGAYWFLDIVATEVVALAKKEPFIHIKMVIDKSPKRQGVKPSQCFLVADDGNDNQLWSRTIAWTDCPEGIWDFYLEDNGEGHVVMLLPSEH